MPELCAAVALGQLERSKELVDIRIGVANLYGEALRGCEWLIPQAVPEGYVHSYWTYVLKLDTDRVDFNWYDFRRQYVEFGGDGPYGAWQLTYLEPAFHGKNFSPGECPAQVYGASLCPVAESIQPKLLQFKTNYLDMAIAEQKAEALQKTIQYFGG